MSPLAVLVVVLCAVPLVSLALLVALVLRAPLLESDPEESALSDLAD